MPTYVYRCPACKSRADLNRTVEERNAPLFCVTPGCESRMQRLVGVGVQINASPTHLRDENRLPTGFGALDALEMAREDEAAYESGWDDSTPTSFDAPVSLDEARGMIDRSDVEQAIREHVEGIVD